MLINMLALVHVEMKRGTDLVFIFTRHYAVVWDKPLAPLRYHSISHKNGFVHTTNRPLHPEFRF